MSAPTRQLPGKGEGLSVRERDDLIVQAELRVVDAEVRVLGAPSDHEAREALQAAERDLRKLYIEHRISRTRYAGAMAGLLVIDIEREHLGKVPADLRGAFAAELDWREAGVWDCIADAATGGAAAEGEAAC